MVIALFSGFEHLNSFLLDTGSKRVVSTAERQLTDEKQRPLSASETTVSVVPEQDAKFLP